MGLRLNATQAGTDTAIVTNGVAGPGTDASTAPPAASKSTAPVAPAARPLAAPARGPALVANGADRRGK